jgi:two-component system chemotaxis response regulator CheB
MRTTADRALGVVALAASAGGIRALGQVLEPLPPELPAAVLLVQHLDPRFPTHLGEILARRTRLAVQLASEGITMEPGHVYVAPPDRHLLANSDLTLSLTQTKLVHFVRPSADLLFESIAATFASRAVAVVLTGSGADGSFGVRAIRAVGGTVIVQDPQTCEYSGMPRAAILTGCVDAVLPLTEIASAIVNLLMPGVGP